MTKHSELPLRFEQSYTNPSSPRRKGDRDLLAAGLLPSGHADDMNELGRLLGGGGKKKKEKKKKLASLGRGRVKHMTLMQFGYEDSP